MIFAQLKIAFSNINWRNDILKMLIIFFINVKNCLTSISLVYISKTFSSSNEDFLTIQACIIAMDPFRGQGGIQMLLTAEQEAQNIVASAKSCKNFIYMSIM